MPDQGVLTQSERQARIDLAAAFRLSVRLGLQVGPCNHFSFAVPGRDDRFLLNGFGLHFSQITASSLIVVDAAGRRIEGDRPAEATAFYIHSRIHRAQARCVLHTHMPYATALTMVEGGRLEFAHQNALRFHGRVAYDDHYNGLALDEAEGDRIVAVLGDAAVLFMASHGVIVVGPTVADAFEDLLYLELACQLQILAQSTGRPLRRVPDAVAAEVGHVWLTRSNNSAAHFRAFKEVLDRDDPSYAQ